MRKCFEYLKDKILKIELYSDSSGRDTFFDNFIVIKEDWNYGFKPDVFKIYQWGWKVLETENEKEVVDWLDKELQNKYKINY